MRYIAVNDGVDTLNKSAMDITPFCNILNEMYSADVSVKIKSAYRARCQQGKFMGTYAPYGYIKDPADHNHLLIDDNVAHVVREIFDLALAGNGLAKIRKHINSQHVLRPAAYVAERGETGYERHFEDNEENRYIWSENSVRGILRSPIYAGNIAGYKRIAANMKSKKRPSKLPEEWEVIPDTHEGIVTQEEFDTVQQLMTSRRREQNAGGFENIFAGVIKCADCGYALRAMSANKRKRPDIIDCVQYTCNNYGRYGNVMCTAHAIEARDLFNAVLADINRFADMAVNDERAIRAIEKRLTETDQSKAKAMEKEQKKLNKRLAELDRLFSSLYEDKVMERITERNFEMISGKYQKEQLEIETRLREVTETLNESYEMMLKLCLCVSQGIPLWDMPTQEGDVLYLCLEDTFCRIQGRLFHLPDEASNRLHFAVASSRLIVIDTLQKVRTASKDSAYASDYENISLIKDFADRHSLAVIVVHHIRKQNDSDVFNKVSGTTGLTGSADAIFVLKKEKRASNAARLYVAGRDMPYQEFTIHFHDCSWELVERKEQEQLAKESVPDVLFRLVDFMQGREEWSGIAMELLAVMGETETAPNVLTKWMNEHRLGFLCENHIRYDFNRNCYPSGERPINAKCRHGISPPLAACPSTPAVRKIERFFRLCLQGVTTLCFAKSCARRSLDSLKAGLTPCPILRLTASDGRM